MKYYSLYCLYVEYMVLTYINYNFYETLKITCIQLFVRRDNPFPIVYTFPMLLRHELNNYNKHQ